MRERATRRSMQWLATASVAFAMTARSLGAQPAQRAILAQKLRTELHRIADETRGVVGAQVIDLATGDRIGVNDTLTFPQGSAIKIPLLIELYRQDAVGQLKLSTRVPVRQAHRTGGD